ncbi:MAG: glycoside hydrolase family 1 protein, partial [Cytophagaceae bacterium]
MRAGHIPLKNKPLLALLLLSCLVVRAQEKPRKAANGTRSSFFDNHPFLWGAASAAYQVEGAYKADGKGLSIWDVWMNRDTIAGKNVTGNVAINFYNRNQYLKDIALFKKQGLTSYRFSVSWPRLIPDGTGAVNPVAVQHYRTFINDLKAAGIEPIMTLYHWDMPAALYQKGGWDNRESVEWFANYANVIFDNFKDQVKVYVLINEMFIETILDFQAEDLAAHRPG